MSKNLFQCQCHKDNEIFGRNIQVTQCASLTVKLSLLSFAIFTLSGFAQFTEKLRDISASANHKLSRIIWNVYFIHRRIKGIWLHFLIQHLSNRREFTRYFRIKFESDAGIQFTKIFLNLGQAGYVITIRHSTEYLW